MQYLVTGGLGVVGSRFVDVVCSAGHRAVVIDAAEEPRNLWTKDRLSKQYGDSVRFLINRLEDRQLVGHTPIIEPPRLASVLDSCDGVLHAAAHTGIPHSEKVPNDDWYSNVDATRNILEVMRVYNLRIPTVMLSSVKPYKIPSIPIVEDWNCVRWDSSLGFRGISEDCILQPDEPYAASKMAQSALGVAYARTYDMPVTVLRCSNLYGDAPCHGPRHGWLTWFCISAALGWPIDLQGSGLQTRDMLFSDDVASAVLASFSNIKSMAGNIYNIGGGFPNQVSCLEAFNILCQFARRQLPQKRSPGRKNEDMLFVTCHDAFTNVTGWNPSIKVLYGIERIYNWALDNRKDLEAIYGSQT